MKLREFANIVEALIFACESPLKEQKLLEVYQRWAAENGGHSRRGSEAVAGAISELNQRYAQSGSSFRIRKAGGGYRMYTLPEFHRWISEFLLDRHSPKLSPAALETLSIIAYRQPVVKSEIDNIRGVDSEGPLHSLLERGLIKTSGRKEAPGRPYVFRTTPEFLSHFGLNDLSELPPEEELISVMKTCADSPEPVGQHQGFFQEAVSAEPPPVTLPESERVSEPGWRQSQDEDSVEAPERRKEFDGERQNSVGP